MQTSRETKATHTQLVEALVRKFEQDRLTVQADHIGHENGAPDPIAGYVPDIYARNSSAAIVAEAETCDSLSDDHTFRQWSAFSRFTSYPGGNFHVIVPKYCVAQAQEQARIWRIRVDCWWWL